MKSLVLFVITGIGVMLGDIVYENINSPLPHTDTIHTITTDTVYKSYDKNGNLYGCETKTIHGIKIVKYK